MRVGVAVSNFIFAIRTLPRWMLIVGGLLVALMAVVIIGLVAGSSEPKLGTGQADVAVATAIPISTSVPPTAIPISDQLRTEKYRTVGSEIYEAALRDDGARVLQLCRQMDDALQQETDQRHDHDLLVEPCNLVVRGSSALSIKSQIAAVIPASEAHKQETVVAIDVQGEQDAGTINYKVSYQICSVEPAKVYQQSGTNDPEKASRWLAEGTTSKVIFDNSYQGCLDGLLGKPSKFGQ